LLETLNPEFPKHVKPGDILIAGRNFGCSSRRALAAEALRGTGVGAAVGELLSRTLYGNRFEIGLPLVEASGVHSRSIASRALRAQRLTAALREPSE